jgi:hypothetical protein
VGVQQANTDDDTESGRSGHEEEARQCDEKAEGTLAPPEELAQGEPEPKPQERA